MAFLDRFERFTIHSFPQMRVVAPCEGIAVKCQDIGCPILILKKCQDVGNPKHRSSRITHLLIFSILA